MGKPTCNVDGCDRRVHVVKRGLCKIHYGRWQKTGTVGPAQKLADRPRVGEVRTCTIDGCDTTRKAKGLCGRHYENLRATGSPIGSVERTPEVRLTEVGWDVTDEGCWEWRGNRNQCGYGRVSINGEPQLAHRAMLSLHVRPPLDDECARHKCDNPPCVNPDHLEWGTHQENMDDLSERLRLGVARRTVPSSN